MKEVVIVSDDICVIKQIVNNINRIDSSSSIKIYDTKEFKNKANKKRYQLKNGIYLIDICNIEEDFLEVIRTLRTNSLEIFIIIIGMKHHLRSFLESNFMLTTYLEKWNDFDKNLKNILFYLLNSKNSTKKEKQIIISDSKIPITLNKYDSIYNFSNAQVLIQYKDGKNSISIPLDYTTKQIQEIIKNTFYVDKSELKTPKKSYYSEPIKQLLVDLYLKFKLDSNFLSKNFQVDVKYIKKWASLSKYNRKISILEFMMIKKFIKTYLKK